MCYRYFVCLHFAERNRPVHGVFRLFAFLYVLFLFRDFFRLVVYWFCFWFGLVWCLVWFCLVWFGLVLGRRPGGSWLVGCLVSQQHDSVSHERVLLDKCRCCHTEI